MNRRQVLWLSVLFLAITANLAHATTSTVRLSVEGMT